MLDMIELGLLGLLAYAIVTGRFWNLVANVRRAVEGLMSDPDKGAK